MKLEEILNGLVPPIKDPLRPVTADFVYKSLWMSTPQCMLGKSLNFPQSTLNQMAPRGVPRELQEINEKLVQVKVQLLFWGSLVQRESEITLSSLVTYTLTDPHYWVSLGFVFRAAFIPHNQFNKVLKHSSQISFHIRTFHIRLMTPEFLEVFAVGADFKVFSLCRN